MTPELQAQQLAEWLDSHPGTEPPEGVDPDVIEALYVLRPDLAPAPRVSIDDILAGVTTGPLAATGGVAGGNGDLSDIEVTDPAISTRSAEERAEDPALRARARMKVVSREAAAREAEAQVIRLEAAASRRWRAQLAGGFALAAAALFALRIGLSAPEDAQAPLAEVMDLEGAAVFEAEEEAAPLAKAAPTAKRESSETIATRQINPPAAAPAPAAGGSVASRGMARSAPSAGVRPKPRPLDDEVGVRSAKPAPQPAPVAMSTPGRGGMAYDSPSVAAAPEALTPAEDAVADVGFAGDLDDAEGSMDIEGGAIGEVLEEADEIADPEALEQKAKESMDMLEAETVAELQAASKVRSRVASRRTRADKASSAAAPAAEAPPPAPPETLDSLRARAVPSDLPGWSAPSTSNTGMVAENTAVLEDMNTGGLVAGNTDSEDPASLEVLVRAPASMGMPAAARAADLYLGQRAWADAARVSRAGLALSSSNNAWRSKLLVSLGDALRGLGDPDSARRAYMQAIELNATRQ